MRIATLCSKAPPLLVLEFKFWKMKCLEDRVTKVDEYGNEKCKIDRFRTATYKDYVIIDYVSDDPSRFQVPGPRTIGPRNLGV